MSQIERTFDEIDLKILEILQDKARIPNAEVARQVGMAPSAVLERIRKLEQQGVIQGYEMRLDPACFGQGLVAFVELQATSCGDIGPALSRIHGVQEVFQTSGDANYLVKLRVTSPRELGERLRDEFAALDGVRSISTRIVLETYKETRKIKLEQQNLSGD